MSIEVRYKSTIWTNLDINEDIEAFSVIAALKNDKNINTFGCLVDSGIGFDNYTDDTTEKEISVADNNGRSTVEVYEDDKLIWKNALCSNLTDDDLEYNKASRLFEQFFRDQQEKNQADGAIWEYKNDIIKLMIGFKQ